MEVTYYKEQESIRDALIGYGARAGEIHAGFCEGARAAVAEMEAREGQEYWCDIRKTLELWMENSAQLAEANTEDLPTPYAYRDQLMAQGFVWALDFILSKNISDSVTAHIELDALKKCYRAYSDGVETACDRVWELVQERPDLNAVLWGIDDLANDASENYTVVEGDLESIRFHCGLVETYWGLLEEFAPEEEADED